MGERIRLVVAAAGVIAVALLLAGCGPKEAAAATSPKLDMPKVAAGKWRITVMVDGQGMGIPMNTCTEATAIDALFISGLPGNGRNCKERTLDKQGATTWEMHSTCNFIRTGDRKADTVVKIDTRVTSDLKSYYQAESKQVFSQPMNGVSQQTIFQKAERIGDC